MHRSICFTFMLVRRVSTALAIVAVLVVYLFFATSGTWHFERVTWYRSYTLLGEGYYASLAEGFLRGHVTAAKHDDRAGR